MLYCHNLSFVSRVGNRCCYTGRFLDFTCVFYGLLKTNKQTNKTVNCDTQAKADISIMV